MSSISGTTANDTLAGGEENDVIFGDAGDDVLDGRRGSDTLSGGPGNDTLIGETDNISDAYLFGPLLYAHSDFSESDGWTTQSLYPRVVGDVNGDGRADVVAFGTSYTRVALGQEDGTFSQIVLYAHDNYATSDGWTNQDQPRMLGDVNGDGKADIIGFGTSNVRVSLAQDNGYFAPTMLFAHDNYAISDGWSTQNQYPRMIGDVNGDGRADIIGIWSNDVRVSLGRTDGTFTPGTILAHSNYAYNDGWTSQNQYPRTVGDVNGDGRADLVGFWSNNVYVSLGQTDGTFSATMILAHSNYSYNDGWTSQNVLVRSVDDVNGDGRADIIGYGAADVRVSFGQVDGTFTSDMILAYEGFGPSAAWYTNDQYPGTVGDVDGDGKADIIRFGSSYTRVALAVLNGDSLIGGEGDDELHGGPGIDTLAGGAGNDIYEVQATFDVVVEVAGEGTDEVRTALSAYTLGANVETLTYTGTGSFAGTGNALANVIAGGTGADTLNGGAGVDTLNGGAGDDVYVVDDSGDRIGEVAGGGTDEARVTANSYTLDDHVENLTFVGTGAFTGTGNAQANIITGGTGADTLDGAAGADTLSGGAGDDVYAVDDAGDVVAEAAGQGTDTVRTTLTAYTLGAEVENLSYTGSAAAVLTGNAANNVISGAAGADTLDGGAGADTLAGGGGNDVYLVADAAYVVVEGSGTGSGTDEVRTALNTHTLAANVETLTYTGSGPAALTGNAGNNLIVAGAGADTLSGDAGNDTLSGGAGADVMTGGLGNDVYQVDDVGDVVTENAGEGTDTVRSSIAYTLGATLEHLTLTGSAAIDGFGNAANNSMTGNNAANRLEGYAGNDTLNGGSGADTLVGGTGNDLYSVDNTGDVLVELAGEGTDTVRSTVTWTLAAEFEHLTLTGSAAVNGTGNAEANILIGNGAANRLQGLDGNDTLSGGAGDDTLEGGIGDDLYVVDSSADMVTELAGEGTDAVQSTASYTLSAEVESLTLTGTAAVDGTGNALANTVTGNGAANVLDGGAGADTMAGGGGDDTYVVDDAGDVVIEAAGGGSDTVRSTVTHVLAVDVENLVLDGGGVIDGTGNGLDNRLTGNAAGNTLSGAAGTDTLDGGAGADTLDGGLGNDTYLVDDAGDVVVEAAGEGIDTVRATLSHTLASEVEGLVLEGTAAIDGSGNALANTLTGNAADNVLNGGGGADTLSGGAGNDLFVIAAPAEGGDTVTDFTAGEDRIAVVGPNFGNVPAGVLSASNFALDAAADGDDWFVFNTTTGVLSFDADGAGAGAAVAIATLNVTMLSATDITVLASSG